MNRAYLFQAGCGRLGTMNTESTDKDGIALLIIEDDELVRTGLQSGLASHGFLPHAVPTGAAGLDELDRTVPDIILLDIFMDDMDGIQVLKHIRKRHPRLPVVLLTGYGSMTTAIEAMRLGANDYLLKPAEAEEVATRLKSALETEAERARHERELG